MAGSRPGEPGFAIHRGIEEKTFYPGNMLERVDRIGDRWRAVIGPAIGMQPSLSAFQQLWPSLSAGLRNS